jgi:hypothetical protein
VPPGTKGQVPMSAIHALPAAVNPHPTSSRINHGCPELDRMILAFLLAINEGFHATSDLEQAASDAERKHFQQVVESARGYSHAIRAQVIVHCLQHGC